MACEKKKGIKTHVVLFFLYKVLEKAKLSFQKMTSGCQRLGIREGLPAWALGNVWKMEMFHILNVVVVIGLIHMSKLMKMYS